GVDSPKMSFAERLNIAGKFAERYQNTKTSAQKALLGAQALRKAAMESYMHPPRNTDFRLVVKQWIFADTRTGLATHQFVKELNRQVPNVDRRKAMSIWLDADGDTSLLRFQSDSVPDAYRKPWELAMKLTDSEKTLAMKIKQDFADKLEDAKLVGLMENGREDYGVPQRWKIKPETDAEAPARDRKKGTPGQINAKLDSRSPFFSFQRETDSYFDGIMSKGVPENLDIGHLVATYDQAFHKSLSSRNMVAALQTTNAADGMPVVKLSGSANVVNKEEGRATFVDSRARNKSDASVAGVPYVSVDHSSLKDWKVAFKDDAGNPIIVNGDMLIHPDHVAYLKNELTNTGLKEVPLIGAVMKTNAFLKASKLSASAFHVFTIGEHMASHLANPFLNGFKLDLREPDQAALVRNGLELGMSNPQMHFEEGLMSAHGGAFNSIPGLGDMSAKLTDGMFKEYIPAIMMKTGLGILKHNRARYSKDTWEGKKLTEDQIAELSAQQMNAAGGFLNYRLQGADGNFWHQLGANKTLLDFQRLAFMAPQFLFARMRVVGQALKPYGHEQRKMLLIQAALLYVGCRILNQLLDDDAHWTDNPFSVVYHKRAYSIRSIVGDFWHLITNPQSFLAGRLAPLLKTSIEATTGRDMRTGARKEPPIATQNPVSRLAQNAVVDLADWLVPITLEGFTPGAAGREQTAGGMILSSIGVGSRKFTASGQIHNLAADFNRNSPDAKAQNFQTQRDSATFAQTPYRKLDALLDAGDLANAKLEYAALIQDGHTAKMMAARYDHSAPYTGNLDREAKFKASLTDEQKKIYTEAKQEQAARQKAFKAISIGGSLDRY
ncbi:MAG: hypothetical protein WCS42_11720, partial [Verrucomicrobiota bacterium]